jgi:bifunctional DNase/RNase
LTNSPIVVQKEVEGQRTLPIWIGLLEATAIASELEGIKFSRPMTHDLLKNIMGLMNVKVNRVEVCDLKNNTYFAVIHINHNGKEMSIDARPSDALAISLRMGAPIFVAEDVIKKSSQVEIKAEPEDTSEQGKRWQEILEKLNPEDWKMKCNARVSADRHLRGGQAPGICFMVWEQMIDCAILFSAALGWDIRALGPL